MECDCRIRLDSKTIHNKKSSMILTFVLVLVTFLISTAGSLSLDCDEINNTKNGTCLCAKNDNWEIDCSVGGKLVSVYPVHLKVFPSQYPEEAILGVKCNPESPTLQWELIQQLDFSEEKIGAKVTKIEMDLCPTVDDGLEGLLHRVNISAKQLKKFTFLSYRNISSIPENFISSFINLEDLILKSNKLEKFPDLSHFPKLASLNLRDNNLNKIPSDAFSQNKNLKKVALTANKISVLEPNAFPETINILDLKGNLISELTKETFSNLKELVVLLLEDNPLDAIDPHSFDNLLSLEELYLSGAKFKSFPTLENLPKLRTLRLSFVNYEPIARQISSTTTLPPIVSGKNSTIALRNLTSLTDFEANHSQLMNLPLVIGVSKLSSISLKSNYIENLTLDFFMQIPAVESIDMSNNLLSELIEIKSLRLRRLVLKNNQLKIIPKNAFQNLGNLEYLDLRGNKIGAVDFHAFDSLNSLQYLDLSFNKISFHDSPFANYSNHDGLGDVSLTSPLQFCSKLRTLKLSHNQIDKIFEDWRTIPTMLTNLDLSYNKLKYVNSIDLQFLILEKLQLNLSFNEISFVDLENYEIYLEAQSSNIDVYLDGNPLDCNCSSYRIKSFFLKSHRLHFDNLTCSHPAHLLNQKLTEISNKKLLCPINEGDGCPEGKCDCWNRPVDNTIIVDCSNRNLTNEDLPPTEWKFKKQYHRWNLGFNFSENNLTDIENNYISSLPQRTKWMDLSRNELTSIEFLSNLNDSSKINFSLANNPFPCDSCQKFVLLWATQSQRILDNDNVTCEVGGYEKLTVQSIHSLIEDCKKPINNSEIRVLIIILAILATLCIFLIFFIIRYSWIIKAFLFSKGWGWCLCWDKDLDSDDQEKIYDAFVSFSHRDEEWVLEELVSRLEEQEGFKLCLHFRDWVPGDWIPDQIVKSVEQSKRTVVILSKNFVESVWSRLEFKAAHAQALSQSSNRLILVVIEDDLKDKDVQDDDLKVYMKMNTYLKWNDPWFWHKLKYALPHRKTHNEECNDNVLQNKQQQHAKAIQLDKLREKLEQNV